MDLADFLRARLDEDGRWALMAAGPIGDHWQADGGQVFAEHPTYAIVDYAGQAAEHIARHDPGRVLAEVEAKRRMMERHRACDDVYYGDVSTCPDMRDLAAPYAYHADYRAEWRP